MIKNTNQHLRNRTCFSQLNKFILCDS